MKKKSTKPVRKAPSKSALKKKIAAEVSLLETFWQSAPRVDTTVPNVKICRYLLELAEQFRLGNVTSVKLSWTGKVGAKLVSTVWLTTPHPDFSPNFTPSGTPGTHLFTEDKKRSSPGCKVLVPSKRFMVPSHSLS